MCEHRSQDTAAPSFPQHATRSVKRLSSRLSRLGLQNGVRSRTLTFIPYPIPQHETTERARTRGNTHARHIHNTRTLGKPKRRVPHQLQLPTARQKRAHAFDGRREAPHGTAPPHASFCIRHSSHTRQGPITGHGAPTARQHDPLCPEAKPGESTTLATTRPSLSLSLSRSHSAAHVATRFLPPPSLLRHGRALTRRPTRTARRIGCPPST